MAIIRLQNEFEKNIYYEYDSSSKPLGEGGMGRVFRGKRVETNSQGIVLREREVAIKCMYDGLPEHVILRARREASIRIKSLNLIEMIDFVEIHKGQNVYFHVVSELLDGINLDELLEGQVDNHDGSPNPFAKKLYNQYQQNRKAFVGTVFRGLLSGISVLHDQGYIHRDIDPSNIMITSNGDVKLIDFGIAKKINDLATTDKQLTSDGQFAGKVCYAAPELVLGDLKHENYTTDIYALGVTLFQLVTGHLPFEGSFAEVYKKQLNDKLPLKEVNDKALRTIIDKATDKNQTKRYQSASEFRVAIDEWMASNDGVDENDGKKKRIIVGAVAATILIGAVLLFVFRTPPPPPSIDSDDKTEQDSIFTYKTSQGQEYDYWGALDSFNIPNGQGKAKFVSSNDGQGGVLFDSCVYIGMFRDGNLEGEGTMKYYGGEWEGRVYEGFFSENEIDTGTMTSNMYYFVGKFKHKDFYNGFLYMLPDSTRSDSVKSEVTNGSY